VTALNVNLTIPAQLLVLIGGGEFSFGETREVDEFLLRSMPADRRTVAFIPAASGSAEYAVHLGKYLQGIDPTVETVNVPIYRGRDSRRQKNLTQLASLPGVIALHATQVFTPSNVNGVPFVGAPTAWGSFSVTGAGVKIAVIDTGIDYTHPALGGGFGPGFKVKGGFDFVDNDADPMDTFGHGTNVSGVIAADPFMVNGEPLTVPVTPEVLCRVFAIIEPPCVIPPLLVDRSTVEPNTLPLSAMAASPTAGAHSTSTKSSTAIA